MKVLLIPSKSEGIVDFRDIKHFVFQNITDINQILTKLMTMQENQYDYKYCLFNEDEFMPFIFKIQNKFINQMQEFQCIRISYRDLNVDDKVKEKMIKSVIQEDKQTEEKILLKKGLCILIHAYGGNGEDKGLKDISLGLNHLNEDVDYTKFLDKII